MTGICRALTLKEISSKTNSCNVFEWQRSRKSKLRYSAEMILEGE